MARFEKLYQSKVLAVTESFGLVVEISKATNGNTVNVWQMYKNDEGEWAYTGTMNGAKNIRVPLNSLVAEFLIEELTKVAAIQKKLEEKAAKEVKKKVEVAPSKAGEIPDLDDPELLAQFAAFLQMNKAQTTSDKPKKKTGKKSSK